MLHQLTGALTEITFKQYKYNAYLMIYYVIYHIRLKFKIPKHISVIHNQYVHDLIDITVT